MEKRLFDFIIAGSGFAGSIAATVLARKGFDVCLIEKQTHPRFAIGESSTPIADMILRSFADRYDLPYLHELSRFGSWQKTHPELLCGIKRGFSYFFHTKGESFQRQKADTEEILVAASSSNRDSDTNWYRPDLDHFLVRKAVESGVQYLDNTRITETRKTSGSDITTINMAGDHSNTDLQCRWIIDATGGSLFAEKHFGVKSESSEFKTNSFALFSHFEGVVHWSKFLTDSGNSNSLYPYNPDHSALHHLIDEGWIWNLRFRNDLLSAGIVFDLNSNMTHIANNLKSNSDNDNNLLWSKILSQYPSVRSLFDTASVFKLPGTIIRTGRLQRKMKTVYGNNWIALNHSAGFVDPLHSTGIAHTLSGLERLFNAIPDNSSSIGLSQESLQEHQQILFKEIELIDLLVSGCYLSRSHYDLFHAYCMVYFACAIAYEQKRLQGIIPESYLCADDPDIFEMVTYAYHQLKNFTDNRSDTHQNNHYVDIVKDLIEPWNIAGLLDPEKSGIYEHTAIRLES